MLELNGHISKLSYTTQPRRRKVTRQ